MKRQSNMTSKGQVTVPKDLRDALGLGPGSRVTFRLTDAGNVEIVRADDDEAKARRSADFLKRLAEVRSVVKLRDEFRNMDGLEYQRWIRPDRIDI